MNLQPLTYAQYENRKVKARMRSEENWVHEKIRTFNISYAHQTNNV